MDPNSFYLLDPDPHSEKLLDPDPHKMNADPQPCLILYEIARTEAGFRSRSRPEPGYLAGAGAVTLARLRLHLKYLLNNSCKIHGT